MTNSRRYISNDTLFDAIVDAASRAEGSHFALGGNAPVMAMRFVVEGCEVLLAAAMTPKLQESLPEGVKGKLSDQWIPNEFIVYLRA